MKIRLLLMAVVSLISISVSSQIRINVLGLTLGASSKTEVTNYLRNNHISYSTNNKGELFAEYVKFGGHTWLVTYFTFYNGKLYCIDFRDNTDYTPKSTMDIVFNKIKDNLLDKYNNYALTFQPCCIEFSDNTMKLMLDYRDDEFPGRSLSLMYVYLPLLQKMVNNDKDEL